MKMDSDFTALMAVLGAFIGVLVILVIIFYLVDAIARFKYLKVRNYANSWMAFIPIANIYSTVEATYGNADKISLYGLILPSVLLKLYGLILGAAAGILSNIPYVGSIAGTVISVASIAIGVQIFRDMMFRLDNDSSVALAIVANIIPIVGAVVILSACKNKTDGQYDYATDTRELPSQTDTNGPLSGFNKQQ